MNDWWQQHEHSRPQRERRSEVEMNRPEGTGDPGGGCACALHEFRGGTVCGVGAEGFASFPCQTDRGLEEQRHTPTATQ